MREASQPLTILSLKRTESRTISFIWAFIENIQLYSEIQTERASVYKEQILEFNCLVTITSNEEIHIPECNAFKFTSLLIKVTISIHLFKTYPGYCWYYDISRRWRKLRRYSRFFHDIRLSQDVIGTFEETESKDLVDSSKE